MVQRGEGRSIALAAARQLFATRGYDDTSVEDVLTASGVSRGALYYHFPDKAELFAAVLEQVESDLLTTVSTQAENISGAVEALKGGLLAFLEAVREPSVRQIVLVDAPRVLGWARWREIDGRYALGMLRGGIANAVNAGELDLDDDLVEPFAHVLLAAVAELAFVASNRQSDSLDLTLAARTVDHLLFRARIVPN
jgi:AcrR family transcriptional regulator